MTLNFEKNVDRVSFVPVLTKNPTSDPTYLIKKNLHLSFRYHVIAANIIDLNQLQKKLSECSGFKFDVPTLLIAECVLVYIDPIKVLSA